MAQNIAISLRRKQYQDAKDSVGKFSFRRETFLMFQPASLPMFWIYSHVLRNMLKRRS